MFAFKQYDSSQVIVVVLISSLSSERPGCCSNIQTVTLSLLLYVSISSCYLHHFDSCRFPSSVVPFTTVSLSLCICFFAGNLDTLFPQPCQVTTEIPPENFDALCVYFSYLRIFLFCCCISAILLPFSKVCFIV